MYCIDTINTLTIPLMSQIFLCSIVFHHNSCYLPDNSHPLVWRCSMRPLCTHYVMVEPWPSPRYNAHLRSPAPPRTTPPRWPPPQDGTCGKHGSIAPGDVCCKIFKVSTSTISLYKPTARAFTCQQNICKHHRILCACLTCGPSPHPAAARTGRGQTARSWAPVCSGLAPPVRRRGPPCPR